MIPGLQISADVISTRNVLECSKIWAFIAETAIGSLVKSEHSVVSDSLRAMDCSLPGSSVHEILQARIFEWVATPPSKGSSQSRNGARVS